METEGTAGVYEDGDGSGVLEFSRDMADCVGKGRNGKMTKHFTTERQRRVQLNEKYNALKSLVPIPTKVFFSIFFQYIAIFELNQGFIMIVISFFVPLFGLPFDLDDEFTIFGL